MTEIIKVLHFIDSGGLYGAETVILNLSREMAAHGGYVPVVGCIVPKRATPNALHATALEFGLPAVKFGINNRLLFIDLPRAALTCRRMKIDLIHAHGYKAFVFAFIIGLLTRIPVISTCHLWFLEGGPPLKMRVMIRLELWLYRFTPFVVSVSQPIRDFLTRSGVRQSRNKIIPNGIRIEDYRHNETERVDRLRSLLGIRHGQQVVLNVGRLSLQKSQRTIVEAAECLRAAGRCVRFLIVGDGELRPDLERAIRAKQLEQVVTVLGFRQDIGDLLAMADIFVLPSIDEGMPMSLLEAVASRTPVITTSVGDIPKLIRHEESGLFVHANDPKGLAEAVQRLASDPTEGRRLAEAGFQTLRDRFSSRKMFDQYREVYQRLCKQGPCL